MNEEKFCKHCGTKIPIDAIICTSCGRQVETLVTAPQQSAPAPQIIINNDNTNQNVNHVSASASLNIGGRNGKKAVNRSTALLLCIVGGWFGAHKFYEGKIGMGIVYACTVGLCMFGWIADIISISKKPKTYYV
ncbi:MAG: TM2 domain-containing protein [Oscillospiraceae bacterium]